MKSSLELLGSQQKDKRHQARTETNTEAKKFTVPLLSVNRNRRGEPGGHSLYQLGLERRAGTWVRSAVCTSDIKIALIHNSGRERLTNQ